MTSIASSSIRYVRLLETNLIDTVALEALRLFELDVYEAIGRNKTLITGTRDRRDTDKEKIKAVLACATQENTRAIQQTASQLFPVIAWAYGAAWHGYDWEEGWSSERRICSARNFDRYFALRLPDGRISDSEFLGFIEVCADRADVDAALADIRERGLLPEMLDRLDRAAMAGKLPIEHIDALLPALFDIAEPLPSQSPPDSFRSENALVTRHDIAATCSGRLAARRCSHPQTKAYLHALQP
ncbi:hypothetical protein ACE103_09560 [Bradyrhizobium sp. ma5]|uniref:hypothetical protein n=1 Tax=Bradyrhizobium sp. ma5 TaxID=3344828 RepID=UPI0035D477E3